MKIIVCTGDSHTWGQGAQGACEGFATPLMGGDLRPVAWESNGYVNLLRRRFGAVAQQWESLGEIYPTPAYCGEIIRMYMARGLSFGENDLDEGEFLEVERIDLDLLVQQVLAGEIRDAKTVAAVLKAKLLLG